MRKGGGNFFGDSLSLQCSKCSLRLCFPRLLHQRSGKCFRCGHEATELLPTRASHPHFVNKQLPQMVIISCLKLQTIRKERNQDSGVEENEENDSVGGTDVLETAGGSVSDAKKPALRNSTYEVSPGNDENICEYLTILSFGKHTWGWLEWVGERFIMLVVFPGDGCKATTS